ncbi:MULTISPECIES: tyrosine recombinase XerC [unclassified Acinetobacter]|uniref:tyrosine recombinase XerC n=1 Tax=unclassified Acinetobacter TaxID=196816 RepID=UPI002934A392|nr:MULTISPECIES: tyrosine recombinase XerC [unclassified Acinetobacter]WOE31470.1 tyrosine recombinase XerC [Acinetobacter sp. SAAs470]WOE39666.1 tyrosine recombinase XerC [Acinetobacter sp. SAAs474]
MQQNTMQLLSMWLKEREIQHHSQHTLIAYERDVADFLNYCDRQKLALNHLETSDLRRYLAAKVEIDQLSSSTMQRMLSAIRQFMKWAEQGHYLVFNPSDDFQLRRQPRPLPGMIDVEIITQILDQPPPSSALQKQLWIRDKAILELLYSSGLRLSEVQGLRIKDIDFQRQLLRVTGKGNKTRIIPFGTKAKDALFVWLECYATWQPNIVAEAQVFITQKGQPLGVRQIENRVKLQAQRAGVSVDLHPHLLRHCFASHMLSNSGDLRVVQEMLGHSNLTTTQIYTHVDFNHLAKVYDQAHPRAQIKKSTL